MLENLALLDFWEAYLHPRVEKSNILTGSFFPALHKSNTDWEHTISDFVTRMYAVVSVRLNFVVPGLQTIVTPFALRIVQQDIEMLKQQTDQVRFFGGENYSYTELDVLAPSIRRLLKKANEKPLALYKETTDEEPEHISSTQLMV